MDRIGLFPLKLVLFPGAVIPLHIFEERYKKLVSESRRDDREFGIILTDSEKMRDIGCTARVINIIKEYEDGRMDILVKGIRRFKLKLFNDGEKAYYVADVVYLNDKNEELNDFLLTGCVDEYNSIVASIKELHLDKLNAENLKTGLPSFHIAQKAGLSLTQRQGLLEMDSENQRLELIYDHLTKVLPLAQEAEKVSTIIKNDGYFKI